MQTAFFDQVVGTAILVFLVCALTNAWNNPPMANLVDIHLEPGEDEGERDEAVGEPIPEPGPERPAGPTT